MKPHRATILRGRSFVGLMDETGKSWGNESDMYIMKGSSVTTVGRVPGTELGHLDGCRADCQGAGQCHGHDGCRVGTFGSNAFGSQHHVHQMALEL